MKENKKKSKEKKNVNLTMNNSQLLNNFVIFETENGKVNIDVYFQNETLWLTQKRIAELFEKGRSTITEHLKKIFEEGELDEKVVCRDFRHTTQHRSNRGEKPNQNCKILQFKSNYRHWLSSKLSQGYYGQNGYLNYLYRSRCY